MKSQDNTFISKLITITLASKLKVSHMELYDIIKDLMEMDDESEILDYIAEQNPSLTDDEAKKLTRDFISLKSEFIKPTQSRKFIFKSLSAITTITAFIFAYPTYTISLWIGGVLVRYFRTVSNGTDIFWKSIAKLKTMRTADKAKDND